MKKFETLLVEYIPRLRRYAHALSNNQYAADDLVQDTLERALNKRLLWRRGSRLRPWLFTIMHNLFINQVRQHGSSPQMLELDENIMDATESPEGTFYAQQLRYSINQLPDDQKEVFLLVSLEGFSYEEVATIMNIPVGTIMSRLSRAREKLRTKISTHQKSIRLRRVK